METWKTIEPGVWKPAKEGDQIIGVLVRKEPRKDKDTSARYYLENQDGIMLVWGTAVIEDKMSYVKVGEKVRIIYKGQTQNNKKQKVNLFEVQVAHTENQGSPAVSVESIEEA